jgi:hypothetical protein
MTPPTNEDWFDSDERLLGHQPYDDCLGSADAGTPPDDGAWKDEGVREPTGSTEGCMAAANAILRLINTVVAESFPVAEIGDRSATIPPSVSERHNP